MQSSVREWLEQRGMDATGTKAEVTSRMNEAMDREWAQSMSLMVGGRFSTSRRSLAYGWSCVKPHRARP